METEQLKRAILRVYATMGDCAAEIGMSKSQFSKSLKNPSQKFLAKLEDAKVKIEWPQEKISESEKENIEAIIKELKIVVYEKNMLIEEQRKIIEQKDKIIKQYEELNAVIKEKK